MPYYLKQGIYNYLRFYTSIILTHLILYNFFTSVKAVALFAWVQMLLFSDNKSFEINLGTNPSRLSYDYILTLIISYITIT